MTILPKKYFTWREPKSFLTVLDEHEWASLRWWHQPFAVVAIAAAALFNWYVARFIPNRHPPDFLVVLLVGVSLGVFIAYAMPWLATTFPSEISISDRSIVRIRGHSQHFRFVDITSFAWRFAPEFSTLVLTTRRGREIWVGVPLQINKDTLSAFLSLRLSPSEPKA